jgi:serine/threonine kinase PknH
MRTLRPGDEFNGYRIEGVLGEGGMGTVYEALQLSLERRVALKILSADLVGDDLKFRERFHREALIQARLTHPHIVTVHDAGEVDGTPYIVMRLIRGTTLKAMFDAGRIPPAKLLGLIGQIAEALDAAHAEELVHRDVKPQNILVRPGDKAYLADFGLTRLVKDSAFTAVGSFVGTVRYIAPEQIAGETTSAADIYSLAVVLFEGLTGTLPFQRSSEVAMLYAHANEPPPRASKVAPELPPALDLVIERGMAKRPEDRYVLAVDLVSAARHAIGLTAPWP